MHDALRDGEAGLRQPMVKILSAEPGTTSGTAGGFGAWAHPHHSADGIGLAP